MIKRVLFSGHDLPLLPSVGVLILRLGFCGIMAANHGWMKLMSFSDMADNFPDPIGIGNSGSMALAVFAEFFCSIAVAAGFMTRLAIIPLLTTMCVAFFIIHGDDPFMKKELAAVFGIAFLSIALIGPGRFSVDSHLQ